MTKKNQVVEAMMAAGNEVERDTLDSLQHKVRRAYLKAALLGNCMRLHPSGKITNQHRESKCIDAQTYQGIVPHSLYFAPDCTQTDLTDFEEDFEQFKAQVAEGKIEDTEAERHEWYFECLDNSLELSDYDDVDDEVAEWVAAGNYTPGA